MEFTTPLHRFENSDLWAYHVVVPADVGMRFVEGDNRRVVCTLEGKLRFQCALMPRGDGEWFININKKIRDKLGLVYGQLVTVSLEKDTSEYGLPVPEELHELLQQDEEGHELFHALTPGKQRNLIYINGQVKSPELRMRRALVIVNHLKVHKGVINFKALNEELKAANRRGI